MKIWIKNIFKNWTFFEGFLFMSEILIIISLSIYIAIIDDVIWKGIISVIATTFGTIGTFLAVKKINGNFIFGITHILLYGIICFSSGIYGSFFLNIFIYIPMSVYGWIYWKKYKNINECICILAEDCRCEKNSNIVKKLSILNWVIIIIGLILSIIILSIILFFINDHSIYLDAASTSISILGMFLMSRYYREQWWIWLIVDVLSLFLWIQVFISSGNISSLTYALMWLLYSINAILGIINWNKKVV